MKTIIIATILALGITGPAYSWEGYDWESGNYVNIESGSLVRPGEEIEIYDYSDGEYKYVEVESVTSDEVEVYDWESGKHRTFEMD